MAVGLLENRARREKSTSNVTTVTDWWWRTGRGGVGWGEDGWGRVEWKESIEWRWRDLECGEDGSGKEHVDTHMAPRFPSMLLSYGGVPVMEGLAGPGVPPRGLCKRCNPFSKHLRLLCFASNRKLKSSLMQSDWIAFLLVFHKRNLRGLKSGRPTYFKSGVLWANMEQVRKKKKKKKKCRA